MVVDEEAVLYALASLMPDVRWTRPGEQENSSRFITISRRVKLFSDVPSDEQPACFQAEWGTAESQVTGMPYKSIIEAVWIVYQNRALDDKELGAVENNLILGGIREALKPAISDPGYFDKRNTLGGLVYHCSINGRIFKDPGDIDGQGMMTIPIKVLVP